MTGVRWRAQSRLYRHTYPDTLPRPAFLLPSHPFQRYSPPMTTSTHRSGSTLLGALMLVVTIAFVGLIALQAMELLHYQSAPSVWPG